MFAHLACSSTKIPHDIVPSSAAYCGELPHQHSPNHLFPLFLLVQKRTFVFASHPLNAVILIVETTEAYTSAPM